MKILVASVDYPPMIGGVASMTAQLARSLARRGHEVTVLSPQLSASINQSENVDFCHDPVFEQGPIEGPVWASIRRKRLVEQIVELQSSAQFDHLFATHFHYYGQAIAALPRDIRPRCSVLFHGFEIRSLLMASYRFKSWRQKLTGVTPTIKDEAKRVIAGSDHVFTNSERTRSIVERLERNVSVSVIGCGVDIDTVKRRFPRISLDSMVDKEQAIKSLGLPLDREYVGFVGRMVESKNVSTILRVIRQLPDSVNAIMVGDGPRLDSLKALSEQLDIAHRISWLGSVSEENKWQALRAMNVCYLLSRDGPQGQMEGFGIVCLEAAAAGTAVIASMQGGIPDAVQNGQTGLLVDPTDVDEIARVTRDLLVNPSRSRELVSRARHAVETRHTWDHVAARVISAWTQ